MHPAPELEPGPPIAQPNDRLVALVYMILREKIPAADMEKLVERLPVHVPHYPDEHSAALAQEVVVAVCSNPAARSD